MWIKICGNTNLDDAQMATALGADAVGFVFAPSARQVSAAQVARIARHLPANVEKVGVFPSLNAGEIVAIAEEAGLDAVQLHGGVSLTLLRELQDSFKGRVKLIQTVHWQLEDAGENAEVFAQQLRGISEDGVAERVLVDSKVGTAIGGTGVTFDWEASRGVLAEARAGLKLIVAGGLRPENVGEAIRRLKPWGVDVASGVELKPGTKDPDKVADFIRNAREAAQKLVDCEELKLLIVRRIPAWRRGELFCLAGKPDGHGPWGFCHGRVEAACVSMLTEVSRARTTVQALATTRWKFSTS